MPFPYLTGPTGRPLLIDNADFLTTSPTSRKAPAAASTGPPPVASPHASPPVSDCRCPPCPGRGYDGHRMQHCAECCFGSGVEADIDCPIHGDSSVPKAAEPAEGSGSA